MTTYKISVVRIDYDVPYSTQEWHRLWDDNTMPESAEKQYGYVTEEGTKTVETQVLHQTVENLDLPAVIKAVNGL